MKVKVVKKIKKEWSEYDKKIAERHIENFEKIYLDEYGLPIDDWRFLEIINEKGGKK